MEISVNVNKLSFAYDLEINFPQIHLWLLALLTRGNNLPLPICFEFIYDPTVNGACHVYTARRITNHDQIDSELIGRRFFR